MGFADALRVAVWYAYEKAAFVSRISVRGVRHHPSILQFKGEEEEFGVVEGVMMDGILGEVIGYMEQEEGEGEDQLEDSFLLLLNGDNNLNLK